MVIDDGVDMMVILIAMFVSVGVFMVLWLLLLMLFVCTRVNLFMVLMLLFLIDNGVVTAVVLLFMNIVVVSAACVDVV